MPNWFRQIPPATRNLIIINLLIWIACVVSHRFGNIITDHLGLHFILADNFNPVQIFTYMFLHDTGSILHVGFNMFTLWMFGRILEQVWGTKRFLFFYFVCGVGAAIIQEAVWGMTYMHDYIQGIAQMNGLTYENMKLAVEMNPGHFQGGIEAFMNSFVTIGASGAIFGLLLGFAFVFPDMPLYLFFIPVPIKAKYMVIGYAVLEFFFGMNGLQLNVAHFAHLGGMLFGLILLLYWKHKGTLRGGRFY